MLKTIFVCDRCKKEWDMKDAKCPQVVKVYIGINFGNSNPLGDIKQDQLWCRPCIMSTGVTTPHSDADAIVAPARMPSFEERFTYLLEELGFERGTDHD